MADREQAPLRDHDARARDLNAQARDLTAEALDRAAVEKAPATERHESLLDESVREARTRASADRGHAAEDRELAAQDREHAAEDREEARFELERAHTDDLTSAYQRGVGLVALQHEIDRARRDGGRLVVGFVDIDGLKVVNDRDGHAAGDAVLRAVALAMRSKMRSYEPIVRFGGDEFVCALADVDIDAARKRFEEIRSELESDQNGETFSVGFAGLRPEDSLDDLIARADADLAEAREGQR